MSADAFRPIGQLPDEVSHEDRDAVSIDLRRYQATDGFEVLIGEDVVRRMKVLARRAAPDEMIGLLMGRVTEDVRGRFVIVTGVVPDGDAAATRTTVRTSHASEVQMRAVGCSVFPDSVPVGWLHSHPGYGTHFSVRDQENQASWREPHALGIVVDPTAPELLGVHRGPRSQRLRPITLPATGMPRPGVVACSGGPQSLSQAVLRRRNARRRTARRLLLAAYAAGAVLVWLGCARLVRSMDDLRAGLAAHGQMVVAPRCPSDTVPAAPLPAPAIVGADDGGGDGGQDAGATVSEAGPTATTRHGARALGLGT